MWLSIVTELLLYLTCNLARCERAMLGDIHRIYILWHSSSKRVLKNVLYLGIMYTESIYVLFYVILALRKEDSIISISFNTHCHHTIIENTLNVSRIQIAVQTGHHQ